MGKCETAKASVGIKILLGDLILQMNETNVDVIKDMLYHGMIEDENDYFNEVYSMIIDDDEKFNTAVEYKEYLTIQFTQKGTYHKSRDGIATPTLEEGCLFDKYLLVPVKDILKTDRWGHNRYGTNAISRSLDFDLSIDIEKYKDIEKIVIVFLLGQHSG
jgi:hypothetical protein